MMNERIKELAEQAMVTVPAAEGPLSHTYFDKEKFAESLIQECVNKVEVWEKDSRNHISHMLKRHWS